MEKGENVIHCQLSHTTEGLFSSIPQLTQSLTLLKTINNDGKETLRTPLVNIPGLKQY